MKINSVFVEKLLTRFIRDELDKFDFAKGILGLSGGLDSAVCACLASRALGPKNVTVLIMPYGDTFGRDVQHAKDLALRLGLNIHITDISPMVDAYFKKHPTKKRILIGNKMARERMSILYDYSEREKALILGTSNKTELLLGYGTIHGDMACAINPLGDLYKTQIRQLSRFMGVPAPIIDKAPSADLIPGQTDEDDLGFTYAEVDRLLYLLVDERFSPADLIAEGFDREMVGRVLQLIRRAQYKRELPIIPKISGRTIGHDFRYLRDWGT